MSIRLDKQQLLNWQAYPLVRILLLFVVGIYASTKLYIGVIQLSGMFIALLIPTLILHSRKTFDDSILRLTSLLILLSFFLLGMIRGGVQKTDINPHHYRHFIKDKHVVSGQIVQEPNPNSTSATLMVSAVDTIPCVGKLLIYFNKEDTTSQYELGDYIAIQARPTAIPSNSNPMAFDYRQFMLYKGIDFQTFVPTQKHQLIRKGRVYLPLHFAQKLRNYALSVFDQYVVQNDNYATASAMVLGKREFISSELQQAFSDTGAVHVLAVSGMHVGIILLIFNFVFNQFFRKTSNRTNIARFSMMLIVAMTYALITGATPAVMRATLMFLLLEIGRLWFGKANIYNIIAFSAILLLMYNPFYIFQLSFLFSYLALLSILFFQPWLMARINKRFYYSSLLVHRFWQLITVSLAAQVLIFPLSVYYFHKFPLSFLVSGVFAVALAPFVLSIGLALIIFSGLPNIAAPIAKVFNILLSWFVKGIYWIQNLPLQPVEQLYFSMTTTVLLYLIILGVMVIIGYKPKRISPVVPLKNRTKHNAKWVITLASIIMVSNATAFTWKNKHHTEILFYDVYKHTLIDIFINGVVYTIKYPDMKPIKEKYTNEVYRTFRGSNPVIEIPMESSYRDVSIIKEGPSLILGDRHYLFVHLLDLQDSFPKTSDVMVISHSTEIYPYKLMKQHETNLVIIDNSINYNISNRWNAYCIKNKIPCHRVRKNGIYRENIE